MIKTFIPQNLEFRKYESELRQLYKANQEKICDTNDFDFIVNKTLFYVFTTITNELIGVIYFFKEDEKLYLNGFGKRGHFKEKIECLKTSFTWFNCDIYAEVQNRASALCLLRAGFRRIEGKLFVYEK